MIVAESFAHSLYISKAWIELRQNLIIARGPICQRCNTIMIDTSKMIGHHIKELTPANIHDVNVTLNPDNIELICFDCHNKEHKRFGTHRRSVYLVYGSPLSGKAALVNQLAERGDIIMDIDRLFACVSGLPLYDKPGNLRFNVFALKDKMLDMIKTRYGQWHDAYVIGGYPVKMERERVARELGAELIYAAASKEECRQRAVATRKGSEWLQYIDRWWAEYEE